MSSATFATGDDGLWKIVAIGAVSNAKMSALEGNNWANVRFSAFVERTSVFIGFNVGKFISNKLLKINANFKFNDYVNMAKIDGTKFLSRNVVTLMP